jgi:acid phosphatase
MPWLVSKGNANGYSSNYFSNVGGSLLDYLWLASGSSETSFGCNGNGCGTGVTDENIFHLMSEGPVSWKVYAENYLNAGGSIASPDQGRGTLYYKRHNAAPWYQHVITNILGSQGQIVDFEQFGIDVAAGTLPRYAIIAPDGAHDAHDSSLCTTDSFLQNNLPAMLNLYDFQPGGSGLLLVTFDNGDNDNQGKVYTAVIGPNVKSGYVSTIFYQHQNALRTMLDSLGIHTYPGGSNGAADMSDFFTSTSGGVAIDSPPNNSTQGTNVAVKASALENGRTIDHLELWDNTTGLKLGNFPGSSMNQTFTFTTGQHQLVVQDMSAGGVVYHKEYSTVNVSSSGGVFITTPANSSTQAAKTTLLPPATSPGFPVVAYAVEAATPIDHLEVWDNGTKLGDSPKGSTINQWYNVAAGSHAITVQDMTSNGTMIHNSTVNVTVTASDGVYVNAPANNSTLSGTTVHVNAYASEFRSSPAVLIDHMEVWDNTHNIKLGNSPSGNGITSLYVDKDFILTKGSGTYQLAISDINTSFVKVHTTYVTVTVP